MIGNIGNIIEGAIERIIGGVAYTPLGKLLVPAGEAINRLTNFRNFVCGEVGSNHKLRPKDKLKLIKQFYKIRKNIPSLSSVEIWVKLAEEILSVPSNEEGDIIECGAYLGGSSSALSLLAKMTGRRLFVCDSFEGLPDDSTAYIDSHRGFRLRYQKGDFTGKIEQVKENIRKYGCIDNVEFVKGYFSDSLKTLPSDAQFVLVFLDVDLISSTRDCLRYIWPKLKSGYKLYTDDARALDIVKIFFDDQFFQSEFGEKAPGFIGGGCGLPLMIEGSCNGYTIRHLDTSQLKERMTYVS